MKKLWLLIILIEMSASINLSAQQPLLSSNIKRQQIGLNIDNLFSSNELKQVTYQRHWKGNTFWGLSLGSEFSAKGLSARSHEHKEATTTYMKQGTVTNWFFLIPWWKNYEFDLSERPDELVEKKISRTLISLDPFVRKIFPLESKKVIHLFVGLGSQFQFNATSRLKKSDMYEVEFGPITEESFWTGVPLFAGEYSDLQYMTRYDEHLHIESVERSGSEFRLNPFAQFGILFLSKKGFGLEGKFQQSLEQSKFRSDLDIGVSYSW